MRRNSHRGSVIRSQTDNTLFVTEGSFNSIACVLAMYFSTNSIRQNNKVAANKRPCSNAQVIAAPNP
jgi:hypothetical protein